MVRINDYSIIRKSATRYEIYYQNNEFCKYASSLVMALYYVLHMIHCVAPNLDCALNHIDEVLDELVFTKNKVQNENEN